MALTVVTTATGDPVTYDEAKVYLRVDGDIEKPLVESLITAATEWAQVKTSRFFMRQTWDLNLDSFPAVIQIPQPPLISIVSIKYIDTDGNTATVSSSDYQVDTDSEPGRVKPAFDKTWPTTRGQFNAVTVQFVGGYATTAKVPDGIKTAIKMAVAHWHENREPVVVGTITAKVPLAVESLLWQHRVLEYR